MIIPLLLSQIILQRYFETETHALVNDWASIACYMIFFLSGFILLPLKSISGAMCKYRRIYLAETAVMTLVMFIVPGHVASERTAEIMYDVAALIMSWTCAVAAIGYAKRYLDFSSPLRKTANEAVYPFYLLHQPALVITGYLTVGLDIAVVAQSSDHNDLLPDPHIISLLVRYQADKYPQDHVRHEAAATEGKNHPYKPRREQAAVRRRTGMNTISQTSKE